MQDSESSRFTRMADELQREGHRVMADVVGPLHLDALLTELAIGVIVADADGRIIGANEPIVQLAGADTRDALRGVLVDDFVLPQHKGRHAEQRCRTSVAARAEKGETFHACVVHTELVRIDGVRVRVTVSVMAFSAVTQSGAAGVALVWKESGK